MKKANVHPIPESAPINPLAPVKDKPQRRRRKVFKSYHFYIQLLTLATFRRKTTITMIPPKVPRRHHPLFLYIWYPLAQNLGYNRLVMVQDSGFMKACHPLWNA
jgi:hypothetical protein